MNSKSSRITKELQSAIRRSERCGLTRYRIAQLAGVSQTLLVKIDQGRGTLRLDSAEAIAGAIGLKLALLPVADTLRSSPKRKGR